MGLAVRRIDGLNCPALVCDVCGERIDVLAECNMTWLALGTAEDSVAAVKVVHKRCDVADGKREQPYWEEGGRFLAWLLCNMKIGRLRRRAGKVTLTLEVPEPLGM